MEQQGRGASAVQVLQHAVSSKSLAVARKSWASEQDAEVVIDHQIGLITWIY